MKSKILIFILSVLCVFCLVSLTACNSEKTNQNKYLVKVENSDLGELVAVSFASAGDVVVVDLNADGDLGVYCLYVNGEKINGNTFTMPACDVTVSATLYTSATSAYNVTILNEDGGKTISNLATATEGQTITLSTYVDYNKKVDYYTVNGSKIEGNTFTMPASNVSVGTVYVELMPETKLVQTVMQSYYNATAYWYAEYSNTAITFNVIVEDYIVYDHYSVDLAGNTIGYIDNVEFVIGPKSTTATSNTSSYYKVLVSASNEYYWQVSNGSGGWSGVSGSITASARQLDLYSDGICGYEVNVTIPYASMGLTYANAYGKLTIAPAMRNTLGSLKTTWASYNKNGVIWGSPKTYIQINSNGEFLLGEEVEQSADYLFLGDSLLSASAWTNFAGDTAILGNTANFADDGKNINYWLNNFDIIQEIGAKEVLISLGTEELKTNGVITTFGMAKELIDKLTEKYPSKKIVIISSIPSASSYADPNKVSAYNSMVKDYVSTLENVAYVDFASAIYQDGLVYSSLYSGTTSLNAEGYVLLRRYILMHYNKYTAQGSVWGDTSVYTQQGTWEEDSSSLVLSSGGTCETYYKTKAGKNFVAQVTLTANFIYNNDAFPKFGISVKNQNKSVYFYIDGSSNLTSNYVGRVEKKVNDFDWGSSKETSVSDLQYSAGKYVTLKVEKVDNKFYFSVNGNVALSVDYDFGIGECTVGIFAFNTSITVSGWQIENKDVASTILAEQQVAITKKQENYLTSVEEV